MISRFRIVGLAVGVWFALMWVVPFAQAQIKRVDLALYGYECNNMCAKDVERALKPFKSSIQSVTMSHTDHRVTLVPKEGERFQMWDVVRQLRKMERIPFRITVLATGQLTDHPLVLPRRHLHMRKALDVPANEIRFVLIEGEHLDALRAFEASGNKEIAVLGEVAAFDSKELPLLVIRQFKEKDAIWSDEEIIPSRKDKAKR